ncbi:MAG: hypothetical protein GY820_39825 [Gammaproteobacteria bacterium]|nr:hypothetical protein [Gammaproteobacteria bacterium]
MASLRIFWDGVVMALTVAKVDAAITDIQDGGQSVTVDGFTYTAANLKSLMTLRDQLKAEEGQSSTRPPFRGVNFSSMGY